MAHTNTASDEYPYGLYNYVGGKDPAALAGTPSVPDQTITYTLVDGTSRIDKTYNA